MTITVQISPYNDLENEIMAEAIHRKLHPRTVLATCFIQAKLRRMPKNLQIDLEEKIDRIHDWPFCRQEAVNA